MAPRQRFVTAKDLDPKKVQQVRRGRHAKDAPPEAADAAKSVVSDRVANADEVREAGDRAAARWGSLLKRLAE